MKQHLAEPLKGDEAQIFASGELMLNGEKTFTSSNAWNYISYISTTWNSWRKISSSKRMFAAVGNRWLNFIELVLMDFK